MPGNLPSGREDGWEALRMGGGAGDSSGPGQPHTSHIPESWEPRSSTALSHCVPHSPRAATSPWSPIPLAPPPLLFPLCLQLPARPQALFYVRLSPSFQGVGGPPLEGQAGRRTPFWNRSPPSPTKLRAKPHPLFPPKEEVPPPSLKQEVPLLPPK